MYREVILEGDYTSWNSHSIKKPTISTCDLCSKLRTNWQGKTLRGRCRKGIYQQIPDWRKGQRRIQHPQEQVLTRMPQQVSITYSTISHFPESLSATCTDKCDINHFGYQWTINYCDKCNFRPEVSKQGHYERAQGLKSISILKQ